MKIEIKNYIRYGIFNNTMYFPYNQPTIEEYIEALKPLAKLIELADYDEILDEIYKTRPNIFIVSYMLCTIGLSDKSYEILKKTIKGRIDLYIFLTFAYYSPNVKRRYIQTLYKDNLDIISDYKNLCFDMFKPNISLIVALKKRNGIIKEIKKSMELSKVDSNTISLIEKEKIHFQELYPCLSYFFDEKYKEHLTKYFIERYGILEIIGFIEEWFVEGMPDIIVECLENEMYELKNIEDIEEIFLIYKTIKDIRLRSLIERVFSDYSPKKSEINICINVIPTQKQKYKIGIKEKYDYLYFNGVNASLLVSEFDGVLHLNHSLIEGEIISKINRINGNEIVLRSEGELVEGKFNILFSSINIEGFNVIWDSTNENEVIFTNKGYLNINGISKHLLPCLIKYLKDNCKEVIKWEEGIKK
ncbi:hypothetical protein [Alkaliphilus sp. B6464]|uniref:hypothetical protein n=1 Tax=Alkaliphilus sp. B6464 TaxID=2731219 RepID=UPI001BA48922|nr:hypothetical protein [Alkaliphilus sp. B6464]QUH22096.1 hypothetical protein HYG84_19510 [Alkaliphilus sp. B6464]